MMPAFAFPSYVVLGDGEVTEIPNVDPRSEGLVAWVPVW